MTLARSYELSDKITDFTKAISTGQQKHEQVKNNGLLLQEISTSLCFSSTVCLAASAGIHDQFFSALQTS
jgi:hypothetical protein